ncbi:MAG: alpha/beta hydrolase [Proteobacteria bacterium]|nr:alpha/beta hydrolase [Pseudomonadota bacterium]
MKEYSQVDLIIPCKSVNLRGSLSVQQTHPGGIVLFVHGSGSSRHSPRNIFVAELLFKSGLSTLLFDLLTEDEEHLEERTRHLRFDIDLLAKRLTEVTEWIMKNPETENMSIGFFGASTGAAAALQTASWLGDRINAVVSRGGRPDLAGEHLRRVKAPTLFIVGSKDETVLKLNRDAMSAMIPGLSSLEIIAGASHLFEEPGTLAEMSELALDFFKVHLLGEHTALQNAGKTNTFIEDGYQEHFD